MIFKNKANIFQKEKNKHVNNFDDTVVFLKVKSIRKNTIRPISQNI